ncbi:MAG: alginate lyase family protein [Pseudomonadota bacterium]|nr:alginate lyase family protein [Pseudomonadota bacterium]
MVQTEILCELAAHYADNGPYSVTHKQNFSLTKDKHDYVSGRLYWWKEGEDYVRRDGQPNPANRGGDFDRQRLEDMVNGAVACTLAWIASDDDQYAKNAARLIDVWFVDPDTRMNPNLEYSQFVPGKKSNGVGIIDTYDFCYLLDAVELLAASGFVDPKPIKDWFSAYLYWLVSSGQGKSEAARKNNHGTSHTVQIARYTAFVGKVWRARYFLWKAKSARIDLQIDGKGKQPHEADRTISLYYHIYNLTKLFHLCLIGNKVGMDLSQYKGKLERGFKYVLPFVRDQQSWPLQQDKEVDFADIGEFVVMGNAFFGIPEAAEYLNLHTDLCAFYQIHDQLCPPPTLMRECLKRL